MDDDARGFSNAGHRPSVPVLAGIVALHVALFYGLIQALAPNLVADTFGPQMSAFNLDLPPPPTPTPEASQSAGPPEDAPGAQGDPGERATPREVSAPEPPIVLPSRTAAPRAASTGNADRSGAADAGDGTGASGSGDGTGAGGQGQGSGGGGIAVEPVLARSITDVSAFPIPPGGRQARVGKQTFVMLDVNAQGRVTGCRVTRSSGFPDTDAKVCELAYRQIRFEPARDSAGNAVPARFHYAQRFFE
ncbi:MAG: TonB family protein [Erythrobacter sp.]|nr:TonB family protein [Erythrobacter sp.]NCQ63281.1 TonB family protein [Alphaproteobacteria bacterium]